MTTARDVVEALGLDPAAQRIDGQLWTYYHTPAGQAARIRRAQMSFQNGHEVCNSPCCEELRAFLATPEYTGVGQDTSP